MSNNFFNPKHKLFRRIISTLIIFPFIPQLSVVTSCSIIGLTCKEEYVFGFTFQIMFNWIKQITYGNLEYLPLVVLHVIFALFISYVFSCFIFKAHSIKLRKTVSSKNRK